MSDDVNDFLMSGGGAPSAKFNTIGDTVRGTIVATKKTQQTDFKTGKPLQYDNGDPKWQIVVTLQTDERDATLADDDGTRSVYVKNQMLAVVRDAVKAAGGKLEVGGTLAIKYASDKPSTSGYDQKIYEAAYKAPVASVSDLLGDTVNAVPGPSVSELV